MLHSKVHVPQCAVGNVPSTVETWCGYSVKHKAYKVVDFLQVMYIHLTQLTLACGVGRGIKPGLERAIDEAGGN